MGRSKREAVLLSKPPSETPEEEAEREAEERRKFSLKRLSTFHNEGKGEKSLEGLGLSDFTRNPAFGKAKLLSTLQSNDHEWAHLLFFEAEKKNLRWMHEGWYGQSPWCTACMWGSTRCLKEMIKVRDSFSVFLIIVRPSLCLSFSLSLFLSFSLLTF